MSAANFTKLIAVISTEMRLKGANEVTISRMKREIIKSIYG